MDFAPRLWYSVDMKLHYMKNFNMDPDSLPHGEHKPNAVQFREAADIKQIAKIASLISLAVFDAALAAALLRYGVRALFSAGAVFGFILSVAVMLPHELLHAVCFKKDAYLYTSLRQGMLFVTGTEDMSKARFIFMSLLPNLVFGLAPFAAGMIFPSQTVLLALGIAAISMGAGDYYNVFNAATQMPKGARCYMYKFNTFWYMP